LPPPPPPRPVGAALKAAPKQAAIDAPPKLLKTIKPDYPKGARQRGEEGDVVLELAINARGGVDSVTVAASCGFPELDAAAARAASRAHFTPAKAGRTAIPSTARLTITFKLTGR
jgi:protein TonB